MESNRHFTTIVIGENPEETMKKYDSSLKVEPYIVYEFAKVKNYKENYIKAYHFNATSQVFSDDIKEEYRLREEELIKMSDIDFYTELTEDFDIDQETGNAICDINPNGKYNWCRIGKELAMPLIDVNNNEIFQERKSNIQWNKIHLAKKEIYEATWEMVMENRTPKTEEEKIIYNNMKNRIDYFNFFGTKEKYVASSTAFWGYAIVNEDGWKEMDENTDECEWINNFYDRFIKNLPDNTLITVFECYRN